MKTPPSLHMSAIACTRAALLAATSLLLPASLFAQVFPTWQGTGTNWGDAANWDATYGYDQLEWTGAGNATSFNNLSSPQSQWRFFFNGSQSYTLSGSDVHFFDFGTTNGGILSQSSVLQTINMNLSFRDNGARPMGIVSTGAGTGALTFNGQIELTNSMTFLGIGSSNSASPITFNGSIVGNKGIVIGTNVFGSTTGFVGTRAVFNGSNSYTGTTEIRRGTIAITNGNSLSTNQVILGLGGAVGLIDAGLQVNGTTTAGNTFSLENTTTNVTINVTNSAAFTITGALINSTGSSAATKFAKAGAGTLILANTASTYAGQLQIGEGTVVIGQSAALGTNITTATRGIDLGLNLRDVSQANNVALLLSNGVTLSNSIFVAANTSSASRTLGIAGSGNATVNNQIFLGGNLTANAGTGNTLTLSGNITNTGSGIIKTGTGTLVLSASNDFTGALDISNGVVLATATRAIPLSSVGNTVRSGAALEVSNGISTPANITINGSGIATNGAIRSIGGSNTFTRTIILGSDARVQADVGTHLVLSNFAAGSNTITGTGFNLTVGGDGTVRLAQVSGAGTVMTGPGGSLTKVGSGTLNLIGTNNYTGNTTVSGGNLTMFNGASNAILSSNIIINGGNLFHVSGGGNASHLITNTANMQISSGSYNLQFLNQNLAQLDMSGGSINITDFAVAQYSGASSVTGGAININGGQGRVIFNNGVALGGATFTYNSTTNHFSSAVRVSNSVTYSSTNIAAASFTNAGAGIGLFEIASTTTNTFDIADAAGVASEVNMNWKVIGSGALRKTGTGTMTLAGTGANTYSGNTVVDGGTLVLNKTAGVNAIASGNVNVGSTATLLVSANNQVADTVTVTLSGGTIERASGVNETMGNLSLTAASTLDYVSGAAGTVTFGTYTPSLSTKLTINGFSLGNTLRFVGSDLSSFIDASYVGTSFDNGYFAINGMESSAFGGFRSAWDSGSSTFTITSVPEPSTVAAAAGLLGLMAWGPLRRRFRKQR